MRQRKQVQGATTYENNLQSRERLVKMTTYMVVWHWQLVDHVLESK
jgi:hypothetical protein